MQNQKGPVALVLAAGMGTRMRSEMPKVLHKVAGLTMLERVLAVARQVGIEECFSVIGHGHERIRAHFTGREGLTHWVLQEPQLGTGDAVRSARSALEGPAREGRTIVILYGDVPLLSKRSLQQFLDGHAASGARVSLVTTDVDDPTHYGRIIRKHSGGALAKIVESKDATPAELEVQEVNIGIYAFHGPTLLDYIARLQPSPVTQEYYLTAVFEMMIADGLFVNPVKLSPAWEFFGINSRVELSQAQTTIRRRKVEQMMIDGVTVHDAATCWVDETVEVGPDTVIHPNVSLLGKTRVGRGCEIRSGAVLQDVVVEDGVVVKEYSVLEASTIGSRSQIGPFSRLRPGTRLASGVHIGNFVEVKNSTMGERTKANHLAYIGDATLGSGCNIGAGTITCNYDGFHKNRTDIGNDVFVGSDCILVAPLRIGSRSFVAAASTVTMDVPEGSLAIAREKQVNKEGYRAKIEERHLQSCPTCQEKAKKAGK